MNPLIHWAAQLLSLSMGESAPSLNEPPHPLGSSITITVYGGERPLPK